jgi:hypothetical protein
MIKKIRREATMAGADKWFIGNVWLGAYETGKPWLASLLYFASAIRAAIKRPIVYSVLFQNFRSIQYRGGQGFSQGSQICYTKLRRFFIFDCPESL